MNIEEAREKLVQKKEKKVWWRSFIEYAVTFSLAGVITGILLNVFFFIGFVPTGSMEPTLHVGCNIYGSRMSYWRNTPSRGDVIIFTGLTHQQEEAILTKRVVGLPGETVEIKSGKTYINGEFYDEPWLAEEPECMDFGPFYVPDNHVFVMGDNRNNSYDSRYWDDPYVNIDEIQGKVVLGSYQSELYSVREKTEERMVNKDE